MPERKRAKNKETGEIVTIIDGKAGRRGGKVKVRRPTGFVIEVASKDLEPLPDDDNAASFKFGKTDD